MEAALPPEASLTDIYDAFALFIHACMTGTGFKLVGVGKDGKLVENSRDTGVESRLPADWAKYDGKFLFKYTSRSVPTLGITVTVEERNGGRAVVQFETSKERKVVFNTPEEKPLSDFMNTNALGMPDVKPNQDQIEKMFKGTRYPIQTIIDRFKINIKEVQEEVEPSQNQPKAISPPAPQKLPDTAQPPALPRPFDDPLQPHRQPIPAGDFPPPGFDDELDMNRRRPYPNLSGRDDRPFNIGQDDLYPQGLGPNDPLRPSLTDPSRGDLRGSGGGMHPTFDDPLFRSDMPSRGYNSQVPPGARYDPVGPGDPQDPNFGGDMPMPGRGLGGRHGPGNGFGPGGGFNGNPFGGGGHGGGSGFGGGGFGDFI